MYSAVSVITPPTAEPVSTSLAMQHCRVDQTSTGEAALIDGYITAARMWAESYLNRALAPQTLQWTLADAPPARGFVYAAPSLFVYPLWYPFPEIWRRWLELPRAPIVGVTSVSRGFWGQADTPLALDTDYEVDTTVQPARLRMLPSSACVWGRDHLSVVYTAGYGSEGGEALPMPIQQAILMMVAFFYERRGDTADDVPSVVRALLAPYRLTSFG